MDWWTLLVAILPSLGLGVLITKLIESAQIKARERRQSERQVWMTLDWERNTRRKWEEYSWKLRSFLVRQGFTEGYNPDQFPPSPEIADPPDHMVR